MSEMLDRVSAAIYAGYELKKTKVPHVWKAMADRQARAAIEAMKYQDGWDEDLFVKVACKKRLEVISSIEFWDDMIDEALK